MDKINIKYKDGKCSYTIRIPENFKWFEIEKYYYFTDKKYDVIHLIYNNSKSQIYSYGIEEKDNDYKKYYYCYDKEEKEQIIKSILINVINHIGFNSLTAIIVNSFGYDVNYLRKQLKRKNILKVDNEEYNVIPKELENETILNVLDYNCEYISKISIIDNNINAELNTNKSVDILKITNNYLKKNNKPLIKLLKID